MKIIYDNIVFALQKAGGISTYWFELSSRLVRDKINISFVSRKSDNIVSAQLQLPHILKIGSKFLSIDRFLTIRLPQVTNRFIFHSSYNRITTNSKAIQVITVHDFVHEYFYGGLRKMIHSFQKSKAIRAASMIIAISENTKRDLVKFFPEIPESRIKVIYNGVSNDFYRLDCANFKVDLDKPFLLFIGSREHYKNFNLAVKMVANCANYDFVIVGAAPNKQEIFFLNTCLNGRWKSFQHVTNAELNDLYNQAFALIYPSSYEGFGIPLLEAMRSGCPFIALNTSSIPEVAGSAGILIDQLNQDTFNDGLAKIIANREEIIEKGFRQADKFSWEKCYQETLQVYRDLYNS